jgi:hypothetical protein
MEGAGAPSQKHPPQSPFTGQFWTTTFCIAFCQSKFSTQETIRKTQKTENWVFVWLSIDRPLKKKKTSFKIR